MYRIPKVQLLIFFVCLIGLPAYTQNDIEELDSLKLKLCEEDDLSTHADLLYEIAEKYYYLDKDSSLVYAKKYLYASLELQDQEWIAYAYYLLSEVFYYIDIDSAFVYSQKYLEEAIAMKDTVWLADAYNTRAYIYDQKGVIDSALYYFQLALEGYKVNSDSFGISSCLNNIGYILSYSIDQSMGVEYFFQALEMAEHINDSGLISDATSNIASYYEDLNELDFAENYYSKSLQINDESKDEFSRALSSINIARIYSKMNRLEEANAELASSKNYLIGLEEDYDQALLYAAYSDCYIEFQQADSAQKYISLLETVLNNNSYAMLTAEYYELKGNLFFLKSDFRQSVNFLSKSQNLLIKLNNRQALSEVYKKKSQAYYALKMYKEAYEENIRAQAYRDSLKMGKVSRIIGSMEQDRLNETEIENIRLEKDLAAKELENKVYRNRTNVYIFGLLILTFSVIIGFGFYSLILYRRRNALLSLKNIRIDQQKKLLEAKNIELKKREEELENANATKDKFFRIIAHDLKNPLSTIIGFSELFLSEDMTSESDDYRSIMEGMNNSAIYSFNLLENLLEWSMSQTGALVADTEPFSIEEVLRKLAKDFTPISNKKGITIVLNCENTPDVWADKNMVLTIIRNLIHNAIKFSFENSEVIIGMKNLKDSVEISINDNGVGMSDKVQSNVFLLDHQKSRSGTNNEKGTGLGLLLCKEFVERNHGEIWVESELDKGSTFYFTLPTISPN